MAPLSLRHNHLLTAALLAACTAPRAPDWSYPIRLGMTRDTVRSLLGLPQENKPGLKSELGSIEWYPLSGISLVIDSAGLVREISFKGNRGQADWIPSTHAIVGNLRLSDRYRSFVETLGPPVTVDTADVTFAATWRMAGVAMTGDFWLRDTNENAQHYPAHSLAWLSIRPAIK